MLLILVGIGIYCYATAGYTRSSDDASPFRYFAISGACYVMILFVSAITLLISSGISWWFTLSAVFVLLVISCVFWTVFTIKSMQREHDKKRTSKFFVAVFVILTALYFLPDIESGIMSAELDHGIILLITGVLVCRFMEYVICYRLTLNAGKGIYDHHVTEIQGRTRVPKEISNSKRYRRMEQKRYQTEKGRNRESSWNYQTVPLSGTILRSDTSGKAEPCVKTEPETGTFRTPDGTMNFDAALAKINGNIGALDSHVCDQQEQQCHEDANEDE